jgi:hypothetical protein
VLALDRHGAGLGIGVIELDAVLERLAERARKAQRLAHADLEAEHARRRRAALGLAEPLGAIERAALR